MCGPIQVLSRKKTVKPTACDQWVRPDLSNLLRAKRLGVQALRKSYVIALLGTWILSAASIPCASADLNLEDGERGYVVLPHCNAADRYFEWTGRGWRQSACVASRPEVTKPSSSQNISRSVDTSPDQPSAARPPASVDPAPARSQPTPPVPLARSRDATSAAQTMPPNRDINLGSSDSSGYLILGLIILSMIGIVSIVGSVPGIARTIDRMFVPRVPSNDPHAQWEGPFGERASSIWPNTSVAEYRREIAALLAIKEQLDAQLEEARAIIREQRAQTKHQQKEKTK